jgi:hypothetical protein
MSSSYRSYFQNIIALAFVYNFFFSAVSWCFNLQFSEFSFSFFSIFFPFFNFIYLFWLFLEN